MSTTQESGAAPVPARDSRRTVIAMVVALVLLVGVGITASAFLGGDCPALPPVDQHAPQLDTEPARAVADTGLPAPEQALGIARDAGQQLALGPVRAGLVAGDATFLVSGSERLIVAGPSLISISPDLGATEASRLGAVGGRDLVPASDGVAVTSPSDPAVFATLNESLHASACGRFASGPSPLAIAPRGHVLGVRGNDLFVSRFSGTEAWSATLDASPTAAAATDTTAVARTAAGAVDAFGLDDGQRRWHTPGSTSALLAVNPLGVLTVTDTTSLSLLGIDDGAVRWQVPLDGPVRDADLRSSRVLAVAGTRLVRIEDGSVSGDVDFAETPLRPVQVASTIAGFTAVQFEIPATPGTDLVLLYGPPE